MLEVFRPPPLSRIALRELAEQCVESGSEGGSSRNFFLDAGRLLYYGTVPKALRLARPVPLWAAAISSCDLRGQCRGFAQRVQLAPKI